MQRSRRHASRDGFEFAIGIADGGGLRFGHALRTPDVLRQRVTIRVGFGYGVARSERIGEAECVSHAYFNAVAEPEPDVLRADVVR